MAGKNNSVYPKGWAKRILAEYGLTPERAVSAWVVYDTHCRGKEMLHHASDITKESLCLTDAEWRYVKSGECLPMKKIGIIQKLKSKYMLWDSRMRYLRWEKRLMEEYELTPDRADEIVNIHYSWTVESDAKLGGNPKLPRPKFTDKELEYIYCGFYEQDRMEMSKLEEKAQMIKNKFISLKHNFARIFHANMEENTISF